MSDFFLSLAILAGYSLVAIAGFMDWYDARWWLRSQWWEMRNRNNHWRDEARPLATFLRIGAMKVNVLSIRNRPYRVPLKRNPPLNVD